MPEFPVELVGVEGGYAAHLVGCDCPERDAVLPGAATRRRFPAISLTDAVARFYSEGPVGVTAPDRFARRACLADMPMNDPTLAPWGTMHTHYMKLAAQEVWSCAQAAFSRSRESTEELTDHTLGAQPWPTWVPSTSDLAAKLRHGYSARLWLACIDGLTGAPTTDAAGGQVVTQTEWVLRRAMEDVMDVNTGYADDVERLHAAYQKKAAAEFMRAARSCLAMVHAHRATRDAVAG